MKIRMETLLTINDLAQYLRLDPQTVSRKAQRGEIPGIKVANRWRFKREEIDRWLHSKTRGQATHEPIGELTWYLKTRPEIKLAYLFGSRARGDASESSDTDMAILFEEDVDRLQQDRILAGIARQSDANLDIVPLNQASSLLRYEAISDGRLLYRATDEESIAHFEMSVYREYFHLERMRRLQFEALEA